MEPLDQFLDALKQSLDGQSFVKLTLSKSGGSDKSFRNVYGRVVAIKGETKLGFTLRYSTKDVTKNFSFEEGINQIGSWLGSDFLNGDLFTVEKDISIQFNKKRKARIGEKKPSIAELPSTVHDKVKKRLIEPIDNIYLKEMGITNAEGEVLKSGQKKFRQINKYIEILDGFLQRASLPNSPHIVDMGSGKGYLTFALYDYLAKTLQLKPQITGIELRQPLVDFCNQLAQKAGFDQLEFVAQDIHDFKPERIDVLIALHACDIATDIAIAKGIQSDASIIVVAPCCHKQIRQQMNCQTEMQAILRHGILEERQAELITDGIRSLLMEAHGYQTKVFEFISTEHTPKNLMIVGVKGKNDELALKKIDKIKDEFGIEYHYLERLLMV